MRNITVNSTQECTLQIYDRSGGILSECERGRRVDVVCVCVCVCVCVSVYVRDRERAREREGESNRVRERQRPPFV